MVLLTRQIPEECKVCFPEVQDLELVVSPPHFPKDLELHHFMVTSFLFFFLI